MSDWSGEEEEEAQKGTTTPPQNDNGDSLHLFA